MSRIVIVEDEERIARFVERGLRAAGYATDVAPSGQAAIAAVRLSRPDLMVLDLGLPDMDGLEVLHTMRDEGYHMPVIMLTAREAVADKVAGFEQGADDYITKPFAMDELLVRIRARLRRVTSEPEILVYGDVRLDLRRRRVSTPDKGSMELSAREFALLEDLMRNGGAVRSREQLLDRVWGFDFDPGSNVVEVYVSYLRRKVGPSRIETLRGAGYRMAEAAAPASSEA